MYCIVPYCIVFLLQLTSNNSHAWNMGMDCYGCLFFTEPTLAYIMKIELYVKLYYIGKQEPIVAHTPWCTVQCSIWTLKSV